MSEAASSWFIMSAALIMSATLLPAATGMMYDVIDAADAFRAPPECPVGCMNWTAALNTSEQAASFADPLVLASLGARCAIPGQAIHSGRGQNLTAMEQAAFYGPICPCRTGTAAIEFHTCTAPLFVPEQINLQLANSTTVVVSFVTHEHSPPNAPPLARLGLASAGGLLNAPISGVSHWYKGLRLGLHLTSISALHHPSAPSAMLSLCLVTITTERSRRCGCDKCC